MSSSFSSARGSEGVRSSRRRNGVSEEGDEEEGKEEELHDEEVDSMDKEVVQGE